MDIQTAKQISIAESRPAVCWIFTCDFAMIGKIKVNNKANDATFVFIRYDF